MKNHVAVLVVGLLTWLSGQAFAQSDETVFKDPRGRYTLSYNKDWKVMMNFGGMPSFFCNWEGCDKGPTSGCTFMASGMELPNKIQEEDLEFILLESANAAVSNTFHETIQGKLTSGLQVHVIGKQKWAVADLEANYVGVKTQGAFWLTMNSEALINITCHAKPNKWPEYRTKFERVLETIAFTERP
jgi:hypothetical protein